MFAAVTPSRGRREASSFVSVETIKSVGMVMRWGPSRSRPQPGTYPARPVEAAQPAPAPAGPERHQLLCHGLRGRPLPLVPFVAAQEVEPPVAALDRTPDHPHN